MTNGQAYVILSAERKRKTHMKQHELMNNHINGTEQSGRLAFDSRCFRMPIKYILWSENGPEGSGI